MSGTGPRPGSDVLVFVAHPDDAEIACGGLLIKMACRGYRTVLIDLTRGELATSGDVATRQREAEEAAGILRLSDRRNLALPDGGLTHQSPDQLAAVVAALRELRPYLVLAPYPRCSHVDHVEAGLLVERAAHLAGIRKWPRGGAAPAADPAAAMSGRPGVLLRFESRIPLDPSFLVDVSEVAEDKRRAIACHRSQFERAGGAPETMINDPAFLAARRSRTRYLGALIGVAEAEPYIAGEPLPVDDPVALFRSAPGPMGRIWGL